MQDNNILKMLKLQDKEVQFDKFVVDDENNAIYAHIFKEVHTCTCPKCKNETKRIHDYREQKIKHPKINGYDVFLILKKARLVCPECGKRFYMDYSNIVNPRFRCSNLLFETIIDNLGNTSMTFGEVAKMNGVSPGVVHRYLNIFAYLMQWNNITRFPKHLGIDEFKGNCDKSKYNLHIYDHDTGNTVAILRSRKIFDIIEFFNHIENRDEVEVVTMDLYASFKNAVKAKLKNAQIVADRFHYTRVVSNALDEFRKALWHNAKGIESKYFKNIKLALLKDIENAPEKDLMKLEEKLNYAFDLSPELKAGYELYQSFLRIKDGSDYAEKAKLFREWIEDALSSTLKEFSSAANTLLIWNKEILNSFKYKYTNSATEGKNNKIKTTKRLGYGYRSLLTLSNLVKLRDCKV